MRGSKKWAPLLGLALGFPGTAFVSAYACKALVDHGALSRGAGFFLFFSLVLGLLTGMVVYAFGPERWK